MYSPRLNKRGFPFGGSFLKSGGTIQKIGGSFKKDGRTNAYSARKSVLLIANVAMLYTYHRANQKTL